jgi:hypothetical protein
MTRAKFKLNVNIPSNKFQYIFFYKQNETKLNGKWGEPVWDRLSKIQLDDYYFACLPDINLF